jgi:hypothetical protein
MKRVVEKQKQSLLNKGKKELKNLLFGSTKKDSTTTKDTTEDKLKNVLNGLFKKKK